ncbi:MAG: hypothetical protein ABIK65_07765 [Candidatus Eisenbacteria bacterium]
MDDLWAFVGRWEEAGARFPHVYPPDVLIGDVPPSLETSLVADARVERLHRKGDPPPAKSGDHRGLIALSWFAEPEEAAPGGSGPHGGLLLPPAAAGKSPPPPYPEGDRPKTYGRAFGAGFYQTSEWMLGNIAVGVVLPEYPGGTYSSAEMASIHAQVRGAMDFWSGRARPFLPGARFVYHMHNQVRIDFDFRSRHPRIEEDRWILDAMEEMGFTWTPERQAEYPVYEYVDSLRTAFRAEWGICLFIPKVPSLRAEYDSYSRLGGPYTVAASGIQKDGGWLVGGEVWLTHVLIHETGHLFWALDESCKSGFCVPCHIRSGYLNVFNKNSMNRDYLCDPVHVDCCMEIPTPRVCEYTLAMVGLRDRDEDNIPDVLDTHPYVGPPRVGDDLLPDTITTVHPVIEGKAACMPLVNYAEYSGVGAHKSFRPQDRRNDVTFNTIEHVIYRIDEMTDEEGNELWLSADPPGGWGKDTTVVSFSFVPDSLTGGDHLITLRAVNTMGNRSSALEHRDSVFVKAIALHDFTALPDYDGDVRISFRVRGGTFGAEARLYRSEPGESEELVAAFPLEENSAKTIVDDASLPGQDRIYRLEVSALGMVWNYESEIRAPAPIVRGNFLSRVTPNPIREGTVISFVVPRGSDVERRVTGGKPSGAPSFGSAKYEQARVELDVFNLAGRRVRTFPRIHAYEGIFVDPVLWDGRDDSGRRLPAGVYFVRMRSGDLSESRKVILLD